MTRCSKCLDKEFECSGCRNKKLSDLKKELMKASPLHLKILITILDGWSWLGWLPYRLRIVKLKIG